MTLRKTTRKDLEYIKSKMEIKTSQQIANHLGMSVSSVSGWKKRIRLGVAEQSLRKNEFEEIHKQRAEYVKENIGVKTRTQMADELKICYSTLIGIISSLGFKNQYVESTVKVKEFSENKKTPVFKVTSKDFWEMDRNEMIRWDIFARTPAYVNEEGVIHKVVFI